MDSKVRVIKEWLDGGIRSDEELLTHYRQSYPMEQEDLEEKAYYSQLRPLIGQLKSEIVDTEGVTRLIREYWHDTRIKGYVPLDEVDEELGRRHIGLSEDRSAKHANDAEAAKQLFF